MAEADTHLTAAITSSRDAYFGHRGHLQRSKAMDRLFADAFELGADHAAEAALAAKADPGELSPDFTDTARAALLWVLWHHQGASSPVGQPIRFALGMGQHDHLNEHQLREAKRWEALRPVNPSVWARGVRPLSNEQIAALWVEHGLDECDPEGFARRIEATHGITGATDGQPT